MAFALLIIGAMLLVTSVKNTQGTLFGLLQGDLTGTNNFVFWLVAILLIGAIGYIPKLKPISNGLLALVIIVLVVAKGNPSNVGGGFFQQFTTALNATTTAAPATTTTSAPSANPTLFPAPAPGTAPEPTLSQLGIGSLGTLGPI